MLLASEDIKQKQNERMNELYPGHKYTVGVSLKAVIKLIKIACLYPGHKCTAGVSLKAVIKLSNQTLSELPASTPDTNIL